MCNFCKKNNEMIKLDFDTGYHQFYIADKGTEEFDSAKFWTDSANSSRLALAYGSIGVYTGSYGHIRAELDIVDKPSNMPLNNYDHVVEGSLEVKSGKLQILDCPFSEIIKEIDMKPGIYRVRVYSSNLASTYINEDDADDFYKVEIWPDTLSDRKVLKQYSGY